MKRVSDSKMPEALKRKLVQRGYLDLDEVKGWSEEEVEKFSRLRGIGVKTIEKLRKWLSGN